MEDYELKVSSGKLLVRKANKTEWIHCVVALVNEVAKLEARSEPKSTARITAGNQSNKKLRICST